MKVDSGRSHRARIEMIPLMDIVFLLLVFFIYAMVTLTAGKQGMAVDLPGESTAEATAENWHVVSIDADGMYWFAKDAVTLGQIQDRVELIQADDPAASVYIQADRASGSGRMLDLMNALREVGCTNFVFVTEQQEP